MLREKWLVCLIGLLLIQGVSVMAENVYFNVTFDGVSIPTPPGYVNTPVTVPVAGVTSTLPTTAYKATNATNLVYPSMTDSVTSVTMGGSGDNVAVLTDNRADKPDYLRFQNDVSEALTTGKFEITLDIMYDSTPATTVTDNGLWFVLYDQAQTATLATYAIFQDTGKVFAYVNSVWTQIGDAGTSSAGEIESIRIVTDLDQKKSWFYLDGVLLAPSGNTYSTDISLSAGGNYGMLQVGTTSAALSKVGINNVVIQTIVPEPATLGLLTISGICAIFRRK